ncbi:MAG TPA: hypothetical protein VHT25_03560 [Solirubrobacteraceae bacterium]|jgi:hypothetical protein|nr:hypothetical protein [Solirubrobacteraceae bacterium]
MSASLLAAVAAVVVIVVAAVLAASMRALRRGPPGVVIGDSRSLTSLDDATGAVRSVQSAVVTLPHDALEQIWSAEYLERLARTYWRFLSRVTLGLIQVRYSEHERSIVLLFRPLKLLTFRAPEYEMGGAHGVVRWRIARGVLVARRGRDGGGYLQIEVRRDPSEHGEQAHLHVNVEVANFYPAISSRLGRRVYDATQSRIHVIVTNRFLRSLARLDLAESRVGRYRA